MKKTQIRFLIYRGRRQIQLASNCYSSIPAKYKNKNKKEKEKPEMIAIYNLTKSGVDHIDTISNIYSSQRKCYKWWQSVFFYLLDIIINNSLIIYNDIHNANKVMVSFRKDLYEMHFAKYIMPKQIEVHFPVYEEEEKECELCKLYKVQYQRHTTRTNTTCSVCHFYLCKKCFSIYHRKYYIYN